MPVIGEFEPLGSREGAVIAALRAALIEIRDGRLGTVWGPAGFAGTGAPVSGRQLICGRCCWKGEPGQPFRHESSAACGIAQAALAGDGDTPDSLAAE